MQLFTFGHMHNTTFSHSPMSNALTCCLPGDKCSPSCQILTRTHLVH